MEKKSNVLLVLSGGTICTSVQDVDGIKTRSIISDADVLLTKFFYEESSSKFAN